MNITTTGNGKCRGGSEIRVMAVHPNYDKIVTTWKIKGREFWDDAGMHFKDGTFFYDHSESTIDIIEFTPDQPFTAIPQDPTPEQQNCMKVFNEMKRLIEDIENHEERVTALERRLHDISPDLK